MRFCDKGTPPSHWCAAALTLALVCALAACSQPKSYIVLTLRSATATPIADVVAVRVTVGQTGETTKVLTYPPPSGLTHFSITQGTETDLSVSFTGGHSGKVDLLVEALGANQCTLGDGLTQVVIKKGNVASATVDLEQRECIAPTDGGTDVHPDAFPGCDPVKPMCQAGDTCQVNCMTRKGECTLGGKGLPGTQCTKNSDCAPGSQCFDYAATGCNVKVCLRFCNDQEICTPGQSADGGATDGGAAEAGPGTNPIGTKSVCMGPVQCGNMTTAYHTCTFACDPRQVAVSANGCPAGLSCLVVANMDQVDCSCPEKSRTGTDGADCLGSAQCAPGYICNMMGASQKCRAICRCNASGMTCAPSDDCAKVPGTSCHALTNDTLFGVCM